MIATPKNQFSLYPILSTENSYYLFLSFLNIRDLENLHQAIQVGQSNLGNKQKNLILSFIFNKKYINKVDRTMSYYMYENKLVSQIDATAVFTIAQKSIQPVKTIMKNYEKFFAELNFKCGMNSEEVDAFRKIITEPELPLPVSIRSHIGKYCSTNFQLFICSKITNQITLEEESEFDNFKGFINSNEQDYLVNILTSKTLVDSQSILQHIKELYISPLSFINKLQSLSQVNFENNHILNFVATVFGLTKNLINSIKVQLSALESDPYVYFTEFLLRYSVYKSYLLQLQENFSSVFETFKNLVEQSLNIKTGKLAQSYPYSIWKILTQLFVNEMKAEISNCFPVYVNLVHKLKVQANNRLYLKANLNSYSNFSHEFQKYEGSPALEYLLDSDNIDNIQVFLSDFVQMAVDLSVQESNVLLCGHSEQDLCGVYEKFEETFVNYQIEALKSLCHSNSHLEMQQEIKQQLEFIEKHFNIKPRTLRTILNRMDNEFIQIDFETVDQQLMQVYRRFFNINDDMIASKNTNKSSITADSDNENNQLDIEGLEYFSQIDEEQTLTEIDI